MLNPSSSTATCYTSDYQGNIKSIILCTVIASNRTVIIRNYCQVADCSAGAVVRFLMLDDFMMNYFYIKDPMDSYNDSIGIRSTTSEGYYYIDETRTNVFATPTL
jgi:hypothetical protein